MLAVHRKDGDVGVSCSYCHQFSPGNKSFLIGQGHLFSPLQSGKSRQKTGDPHHSGEDHVAALRVAKSNYSPTTATIFLRRQENGPLLPFQPVCVEEESVAEQRETILAELSKGGPWTINAFERSMKDHPFMPGRNAIRRALDFFATTGVVVERPGPRGAKYLEVVANPALTSPLASSPPAS